MNSLSAFAGGVLEQASSRLRLEHAPAADKSGLKSLRRTSPLPRRLQGKDGHFAGSRNPARARSRYATPVDETIRRADADGTRTGNFHSNSPAVVRSVSTEAVVRFRHPFHCQVLGRQTFGHRTVEFLCRRFFRSRTKHYRAEEPGRGHLTNT